MAISIPQGYIVTSNEPIDNRLIMTKEQMKFMSRAQGMLPTVYFCLCSEKDDKGLYKIYVYDARKTDAEWSDETGFYEVYKADVADLPYDKLLDKPAFELPTGDKTIEGTHKPDYYGLQTLLTNGNAIGSLDAGEIKVLFDNDTLKINSNGELYANVDLTELRQMINDEISRAKTSEGMLFNLIDAEQTRATTKENTLTNDLAAEVNRALGSEGVLRADILNEIQRAKTSEGLLFTTKQNKLTDGDGIRFTGDTISVDLLKGNVLPNRTGANGKALILNNSELAWGDTGKIDKIKVTDGTTLKELPIVDKSVTITVGNGLKTSTAGVVSLDLKETNQKVITTDTATPLIDIVNGNELRLDPTFLNRLELKEFKKNIIDSEGINDPKFYPTVQLLNTEVSKRQKDLNAGNAIKLTSEGVDKEKIDVLYDALLNDSESTIGLRNNHLYARDVIWDTIGSSKGTLRDLIPNGAGSTTTQDPSGRNRLVDYDTFINALTSSLGVFRGTFNSEAALETAFPKGACDKNDYAFVTHISSEGTFYDRYKCVDKAGDNWEYEFRIATSAFTADQWKALESMATLEDLTDLKDHIQNVVHQTAITNKQAYKLTMDNQGHITSTELYNPEWQLSVDNRTVASPTDSRIVKTAPYILQGTDTNKNAVRIARAGVASGNSSVAMGSGSQSTGSYSISGGLNAKAQGSASIAFGNEPVASGNYSVAMGYQSSATGGQSVALGNSVTASGSYSFAEGNTTTASGQASHAEGAGSVAQGMVSHAEGQSTFASGINSHAEGFNTVASGDVSHAEGGSLEGDAVTASGVSSHAEGQSTLAEGAISHAEGFESKAHGDYTHAEGWRTNTYGEGTHAEGVETSAGNPFVVVQGAHAEGLSTSASANYSHAEGSNTAAEGEASHAEGKSTEAIGEGSHAEGSDSWAYGRASHVEGIQTIAGDEFDPDIQAAHAEGLNTKALGLASHAEGGDTEASGESSHAEGQGAKAIGNYSHAEGVAQAIGSLSHAEGGRVEEIGIGNGPVAFGPSSHAEGVGTRTNGEASHAEGRNTIASSNNQHVQGQWNVEDTGKLYADIVGWGTSNTARKNISALTTSGDLHIKQDFYFQSDDDGQNGYKLPYTIVNKTGTSETGLVAKKEHIYIYGTLSKLVVSSVPSDGITDIIFTTNSTFVDSNVTLPTGVKKPKDFTFEPSKTYEINILNNLALIGVWE